MSTNLKYLELWNRELTGKFNARELQNMWRILSREAAEPDIPLIIERLAAGEPFDYILGHSEFYSLPFRVNGAVLIPRPETEELVAWVLEDNGAGKALKILDIGTGSGCIAIALAKHRPSWQVKGLDISAEALEVARENASLNGVKITLMENDILHTVPEGQYDLVISNPPYIKESESAHMSASTLQFEPHSALFTGNEDALIFYHRIGKIARQLLLPGGRLYFELNEFQADAIAECLMDLGFHVELRKDMQGKDRMLKAVPKE